jgi:hypothetical protein
MIPYALAAVSAILPSLLPPQPPLMHPNPAARKRSLVGRGLQALARGDYQRVRQLTEQLQREGLADG